MTRMWANGAVAVGLVLAVLPSACAPASDAKPENVAVVSGSDRPIDPKGWTIATPAAGATNSLRIMFPAAMDPAVLDTLNILAPNGRPLMGDAIIGRGELMWSFAPNGAWQAGDYELVAGATRTGIRFSVR